MANIINAVQKLQKDKKLILGVTNIIKMIECPIQSLLYAQSLKPFFSFKTSKAMLTGVISHYCYDIYYDLSVKPEPNVEDINVLMDVAIDKLKKERPDEYKVYLTYPDIIKAKAFNYIKMFLKSVNFMPIPYRRELYVNYGMVEGIFDRLDIINNNKLLLTDYKTADSFPKDDLLDKYKEQIGGYMWLIHKLNLNKDYELLPPRIIVFRNASWKTVVIDDWMNWMTDFNGILYYTSEKILKIIKKKTFDLENDRMCIFCLCKSHCPKF
jgi:hypothetical protein